MKEFNWYINESYYPTADPCVLGPSWVTFEDGRVLDDPLDIPDSGGMMGAGIGPTYQHV